jgi:signal transduction histidine kinase
MTLRRKLLTVFAALALMSLLSAGLTIWSTLQQYERLDALDEQYRQGLLLHRIRTTSGTLFRRHALAVLVETPRGAAHFEELDGRVRADLDALAEHASREEDVRVVKRVREAYEAVVSPLLGALHPMPDVEGLPPEELVRHAHERYLSFGRLVDESLERNQHMREVIHARVARLRETVLFAVAASAFGTLCLVLLLAAYVASDIFGPLRELEEALDAAALGDLDRRLEVNRDDELGGLVRAYHRLMDAAAGWSRGRGASTRIGQSTTTELSAGDLRMLLYDTVALSHRDLAHRSIGVTVDVPADIPAVRVDRGRLREALELLVEDALESLDPGGRLWLRVSGEGDGVEEPARLLFEVAHDGSTGEPSEAHDEGLARGEAAAGASRLERVRQVAEAHGGALDVRAASGRGQLVILELPALAPRRARATPRAASRT